MAARPEPLAIPQAFVDRATTGRTTIRTVIDRDLPTGGSSVAEGVKAGDQSVGRPRLFAPSRQADDRRNDPAQAVMPPHPLPASQMGKNNRRLTGS